MAWEDVALYFARHLRGCRILDFGCGEGVLLSRLHPDNDLVGVDVSEATVRRSAARCGERATIVQVGIDDPLPFCNRAFDAVITTEVIEHVPNEATTISEWARVLKPGGLLILTTPHQHWLSALDLGNLKFRFPRLHRLLRTRVGRMRGEDYNARFSGRSGLIGDVSVQADPWHRHYTLGQLDGLLSGAFEIEQYYIYGHLTRLLWPAAKAFDRICRPIGQWLRRADHSSRRTFSRQGFDICVVARRRNSGEIR